MNKSSNIQPLYAYLPQRSYVDTWVAGGELPIQLASSYYSDERKGTQTPDELIQRNFTGIIDEAGFNSVVYSPAIPGNVLKNVTIGKVVLDGKTVGENMVLEQHMEDALILCFSLRLSGEIARKLGENTDQHRKYCVAVTDVDALKESIDKQLAIEGTGQAVQYTSGGNRHHFLKSKEDKWQEEYRIVWKLDEPRTILLPGGLAKEVAIPE